MRFIVHARHHDVATFHQFRGRIDTNFQRVVEQTFGVDAFQLTPSLIDPYSQSTTNRINPSARVTIGKRISDRIYLTFSRSLRKTSCETRKWFSVWVVVKRS